MTIFTKLAAAMHGGYTPACLGAAGLLGLGVIGYAFGPVAVYSESTQAAMEAEETFDLPREKAAVVSTFKKLLASSHAVIDVRTGAHGGQEIVLWMSDTRDPGVVNEDETLLITFAPLLRAVIAMTVPTPTDAPPAMQTSLLFSDTLASQWRSRTDVKQNVIATDVTELRMKRISQSNGESSIEVRLTFAGNRADDDPERRAQAMFVVTLPAIARSR